MKHVLFVCNHNAGRSQMAEAFFNHHAPEDIRAESAGNDPAAEIWPEVVAAMAERGFELAGQEPKKVTVEMQLRADWAVTVGCEDTCPFVPTTLEEWEIPDPAGRPLAEVREIRDLVEQQILTLLATHLTAIRGDSTHHEQWLRQLLPATDARVRGKPRATGDSRVRRRGSSTVRRSPRTVLRRRARATRGPRAPARANACVIDLSPSHGYFDTGSSL